MLFHKRLPKKADIYVLSQRSSRFSLKNSPLKPLQILGIMVIGYLLIFDMTILLPSQQASASVKQAENANFYGGNGGDQGDSGYNYNNTWGRIYSPSGQSSTSMNYPSFPNNTVAYTPPAIVSPEPPIQTQTFNFASNPAPQQFQPVQPIQQNGQNIGGISNQIVSEQQQISGLMQRCVQNAQLMANQIIALKNQQKSLQDQLDALNNQQEPNFDTSTQQGQQQQQAWEQQHQQRQQHLQSQIDNLGNTISNDQNSFSNANGQCQQQVGQLEQNRETLEGSLDDTFNKAINIQIPDPQ